MKVLLCDDKEQELPRRADLLRKGWEASGGGDLHITELGPKGNALAGALQALFSSATDAVGGKAPGKTTFDDYDLVVIDNNLSELELQGARHTAETICGWVRALSSSRYIVALDRSLVDFDLEYLVGDPTSLADLSIRSEHLALSGLWQRASTGAEFRPSYWPDLRESPVRRKHQIEKLKAALDKPILSFLDFPAEAASKLSRAAIATLSPKVELPDEDHAKQIENLTFRSYFVEAARSIPAPSDREALAARDDIVIRVVASEIEAWLRREILAPQDVLVDLPHLLDRMPFLLAEGAPELARWNAAVTSVAAPFGLNTTLYDDHLAKWLRPGDDWIARPTFWWPSVAADEKLSEAYFDIPDTTAGDYYYCEDVSAFVGVGGKDDAQPSEFSMRSDTPWNRRYVVRLEHYAYAPRSQFAL